MTLHELLSFRVGRVPGCEGTGSNWSPEVNLSIVAFGDVRKLKGNGTPEFTQRPPGDLEPNAFVPSATL